MKRELLIFALIVSTVSLWALLTRPSSEAMSSSPTRMAEKESIAFGLGLANWSSSQVFMMPQLPVNGTTLTLTAGERGLAVEVTNNGSVPFRIPLEGREPESSLTLQDMDLSYWHTGGTLFERGWCATGLAWKDYMLPPGKSCRIRIPYEKIAVFWKPDYQNALQVSLHGLYSNAVTLPLDEIEQARRRERKRWVEETRKAGVEPDPSMLDY